MRIAIGIALAAALLFAAILLLRPAVEPPAAQRADPPAAKAPSNAPSVAAPSSTPTVPVAKAIDTRGLLAELSRALHHGDEQAVRALLDRLRHLLLPPVPDERNAALLYLQALDTVKEIYPTGNERRSFDAIFSGKDPGEGDLKTLREWFGRNADVLAKITPLLREAGERPECRFPTDAEWAMGAGMKVMVRMQMASQILVGQAALLRLDGDGAGAAESLRAALAMSRGMRSDPTLVSQMIASALEGVAFESAQREGSLGAPRIAAIVEALDPASIRGAFDRSLLGEVYGTVLEFQKWKADPAAVKDEALRAWVRGPLAAQDVSAYVDMISEFAAVFERPSAVGGAEIEALARKHGEAAPWYASLSKTQVNAFPGVLRERASSEARVALLQTALELERYRAREGGYPAAFDALGVPPPRDPFTGQPFIYRREGGGFVLEIAGEVPKKERLVWRSR